MVSYQYHIHAWSLLFLTQKIMLLLMYLFFTIMMGGNHAGSARGKPMTIRRLSADLSIKVWLDGNTWGELELKTMRIITRIIKYDIKARYHSVNMYWWSLEALSTTSRLYYTGCMRTIGLALCTSSWLNGKVYTVQIVHFRQDLYLQKDQNGILYRRLNK